MKVSKLGVINILTMGIRFMPKKKKKEKEFQLSSTTAIWHRSVDSKVFKKLPKSATFFVKKINK